MDAGVDVIAGEQAAAAGQAVRQPAAGAAGRSPRGWPCSPTSTVGRAGAWNCPTSAPGWPRWTWRTRTPACGPRWTCRTGGCIRRSAARSGCSGCVPGPRRRPVCRRGAVRHGRAGRAARGCARWPRRTWSARSGSEPVRHARPGPAARQGDSRRPSCPPSDAGRRRWAGCSVLPVRLRRGPPAAAPARRRPGLHQPAYPRHRAARCWCRPARHWTGSTRSGRTCPRCCAPPWPRGRHRDAWQLVAAVRRTS